MPCKKSRLDARRAVSVARGLCLAKIKSAFVMNDMREGHVTCHRDDIKSLRSLCAGQDIARTKNMTLNGQAPQDFAKGLNNQQAILRNEPFLNFLQG